MESKWLFAQQSVNYCSATKITVWKLFHQLRKPVCVVIAHKKTCVCVFRSPPKYKPPPPKKTNSSANKVILEWLERAEWGYRSPSVSEQEMFQHCMCCVLKNYCVVVSRLSRQFILSLALILPPLNAAEFSRPVPLSGLQPIQSAVNGFMVPLCHVFVG